MKTLFLSSFLFQKVLESENFKVVVLLDEPLSVGEQLQIIEGREGFTSQRSIRVFRYVKSIYDSEQITSDDILVSLELSSLPISVKDKSFGLTVKI